MRRTPRRSRCAGIAIGIATLALSAALAGPAWALEGQFTSDFAVERCSFANGGGQNPYVSLEPGHRLVLEGESDGEQTRVEIVIEGETKAVDFVARNGARVRVLTRVMVEREWKDGEIVEVSHNYVARCRQTNDVFYFGEAVDNYEHGQIVNHDGSWEVGVDGAQPGILMPARFLLGARYYQEQAPGALDRAENSEMGLSLHLAGRRMRDCVAVAETTPLEPGDVSVKVYCPGVGMVVDDDIELTSFSR